MIKSDIWKAKRIKHKPIFQLRERRAYSEELIQADASPHDWFEGRRDKCALIVYIDDATSELMKLKFFELETTMAYAEVLQEYIHEFGRFRALYTDRHSIFKVTRGAESLKGVKKTQFSRMLEDLDIELITANTPQAKGRVERANKTLQDRLVKELRLRKIDTIEEANKFLDDEFRHILNEKFMVKAKNSKDMHRPLLHDEKDEFKIFSVQIERTASKNLEIQHENIIYQLESKLHPYTMKKDTVLVCKGINKEIKIYYKGEELKYKKYKKAAKLLDTQSSKTVNNVVDLVIEKQEVSEVERLKDYICFK